MAESPQRQKSSPLHLPATLLLTGVSFLGAFSRFTSGQYTPAWYAFQLARAPNSAGTIQGWLIPTMDIVLGASLLSRRTRRAGAAIITVFFALGLGMRVAAKQTWGADALLLGLAVAVVGTS
ncbi:hypothetical protein FB451DRAFT_402077 [Mycena latifolia]|nr:hypothetical protein FB451DRAFT_402077 [Mycena latifolia]